MHTPVTTAEYPAPFTTYDPPALLMADRCAKRSSESMLLLTTASGPAPTGQNRRDIIMLAMHTPSIDAMSYRLL